MYLFVKDLKKEHGCEKCCCDEHSRYCNTDKCNVAQEITGKYCNTDHGYFVETADGVMK